ncbi:hypothetical protein K470DRAFT_270105 [Piedraia hortae CBS 480.64]|uniref:SUI1 domain-containing protein n=1 Tax=Piedraia hortae CBS 480.64 TaxID=1314780 RepID=A0A6A7C179_9PEZI|nr:hypothetical protein K470DRAFT_270105 [Piedraia hortae CBS 480.64]
MFKKKPQVKPVAPLRSSDRRKLADQLIDTFHLEPESLDGSQLQHSKLEADNTNGSKINGQSNGDQPTQTQQLQDHEKDEHIQSKARLRNSVLPENVQSARFTTTHGPDLEPVSGTFYIGSHDGSDPRILWFQLADRIYPTVYTLWRHPRMVPLLHTPQNVIKKLQSGADLMTPGLVGGPPFPAGAQTGAIVAIADSARPGVPLAVGVCIVDVSALDEVQGIRGRAVENMHWYGDELWDWSPNGRAGQIPPEEGWRQGTVKVASEADGVEQDANASGEIDRGASDEDNEDGGVVVPEKPMTQQAIDNAFRNAFLYGLYNQQKTHKRDDAFGLDYPLSQSYVMSTLINPFLPAFTPAQAAQLQMKKTSWKSMKKFIKSLDKEGIVKCKDQKAETVILDIDFDETAVQEFVPYRLPKPEASAERTEKPQPSEEQSDNSVGQKIQVINYYKSTGTQRPLFPVGAVHLTLSEVRDVLAEYIKQESLIVPSQPRMVYLDAILSTAIGSSSSNIISGDSNDSRPRMSRDALFDRIRQSMSPAHSIIRNDESDKAIIRNGPPPQINIVMEKRGGNRKATRVSGLENYFISPKDFADELRKLCAGSTSVEAIAGAAKKHEKPVMGVMVQGQQKNAVLKALEKRGVQQKWVSVVEKC